MNLNELRDRAYKNAVAHGWHGEDKSHCHWLCLVISELMEAVEADRKGKKANKSRFNIEIKRYENLVEESVNSSHLLKSLSKILSRMSLQMPVSGYLITLD